MGNYEALTRFVREWIVEPELSFNRLETTRSAANSIIGAFKDRGWGVEEFTHKPSGKTRHRFVSPDGTIVLTMNGAKVSRHPLHTEQICQRKHLTKKMLHFDGIPTPAGADFTSRERTVAEAYFAKVPKPVVVKPTNAGGSEGVTVGVVDLDEFKAAWSYALSEGRTNSNVLVEQFVRGLELRAMVIGEKVTSVVARIQPFVVGDGTAPLRQLIDLSNEKRRVHYRAMQLPVVVDWGFIEQRGYGPESVPPHGEIVYLAAIALPARGALLVDMTSAVSEGIKDMCVRAMKSIPDLEVAGVDVLVEDITDASTASVLEVNTAPSLNLHRYVTHGEPRDVDLDIVEYFHGQYLAGTSMPA
ncbi:ATP-binding protein [Brachybacterium sp. AOP42-B2-9]|uniref:ATP-binding protein n=1 Tax=Brachybacterium sp. AOP42-B2-9 TaxID=3457672 RepID=UPI004034A210